MKNLFDTQLANSFLDGQFSIGYQALVEQEMEIILNKNETRSNWIRRPLSDSQLKYASLDVEYLIHLYKAQKEKLISTPKLGWHDQEINRLLEVTFNPIIYQFLDHAIPSWVCLLILLFEHCRDELNTLHLKKHILAVNQTKVF